MKKVLIMEDELNIRSFVVINLKRAGYDVIEAGDGQQALDAIAANPDVGVAILDIMVPGDMDGFEVCRRIRATNKQMGVVMLTARTQEMDKVTGLMTGADDYVTKPFSPAELTARIDALLPPDRRRYQRQLGAADPGPLCDEHPEPHPGEKWQPDSADSGGVCHFEAVYAESRQSPVPGGYHVRSLGTGL